VFVEQTHKLLRFDETARREYIPLTRLAPTPPFPVVALLLPLSHIVVIPQNRNNRNRGRWGSRVGNRFAVAVRTRRRFGMNVWYSRARTIPTAKGSLRHTSCAYERRALM
jgi:hypothetical protein